MEAAEKSSLFTVAFIDAETLETEVILPYIPDGSRAAVSLSVYAVVQMLSKRYRTEFVAALNHHHSFECFANCEGQRMSVSLSTTGVFGERWSHLLVVGSDQSSVRPA